MAGKSDLAERIAARGWSKTAAASAVDAVLDQITAALVAGERVTLTGFGTFETAGRAARTARNPQTGAAIDVPATTVARFHPGATLRTRVASGKVAPLGALPAGPDAPLSPAAPATPATPAPAKASAPDKVTTQAQVPAVKKPKAKDAAAAKNAVKSKPEAKKTAAKKVSKPAEKAATKAVAATGKKKADAKSKAKKKK